MLTGAKAGSKERRKHLRLPLSIPVFIRGLGADGREFLEFATALNVSANGMLLVVRRSLPLAASLSLEIPVAPVPKVDLSLRSTRNFEAKVVRVDHGERYHLIGLKFHRLLDASSGRTSPSRRAAD